MAEDMKVEGRETLRGYWTDIAKDIQVEMEVAKLNGKKLFCPKRASMLVAVGKFMGVSSDSLITSIMAYGERNSLVHSGINEFLQKKHYSTVAKLLWQDEKDLPLIMPPERSEEKEALLQIIVALREDIFDIEPGEEDNHQSWNHIRLAEKFARTESWPKQGRQRLQQRQQTELCKIRNKRKNWMRSSIELGRGGR